MINKKYYEMHCNELSNERSDAPILPTHNARLPNLHFWKKLKNKLIYHNNEVLAR